MDDYKPPLTMTDEITNLVADVSEQIGRITVLSHGGINPRLRRGNRIRTIHSTLAIESNSLSLEQVTAILDGKRILGNPNEIREVRNAYDTYEMMLSLDPLSVDDLLKAHGMMMAGLIPEAGRFRAGGVGLFNGERVVHMAPPASLVPGEMASLFAWYRGATMHPLIKSAVFHYEFEFIHPFADGNGRMGRLWHTMLLGSWNELFYWLPVEELIQARQQDYYAALTRCDHAGESSAFVELMLEIIRDALRDLTVVGGATDTFGTITPKVTDGVTEKVTDNEARVLELLREDPGYTMPQLAARIGVSRKTIAVYLRNLKENGVITRVGSNRRGWWRINGDTGNDGGDNEGKEG